MALLPDNSGAVEFSDKLQTRVRWRFEDENDFSSAKTEPENKDAIAKNNNSET